MLPEPIYGNRTCMTEKNVQSEDYISFSSLKLFLIRILRFFFTGLKLPGYIFKRHYLLFIAGIIVGGSVGWLYALAVGKNYKVSMIVEYNMLDKTTYRNIVDELEAMIKLGSKDRLAAQLGISPALAENVNSLGTENLIGQSLAGDTTTNRTTMFKIVAELESPRGADSLGEALLAYINGLPYLKGEMEEQMRIRQDQLSFIREEMVRIDSLKRDYLHSLPAAKSVSGHYDIIFDPASIYKQSYSLDSQKAEIRKDMIHQEKALSEITAFKAAEHPNALARSTTMPPFMAAGLVLAFLLGVLQEIKKKVNAKLL
jgi:hypothetical protein